MDTKKVLWGIIIFLLSLVVIYKICNIFITPVDPLDPLDVIYEYDDQEISVRKLFEASYEDIYYADHWVATGKYCYKCERISNPDSEEFSTSEIINKEIINLTYDHYHDNTDNHLGILSGKRTYPYHEDSIIGDRKTTNQIATFKYYDGIISGTTRQIYEYTGHKCSCKVSLEKILVPDLDNISEAVSKGEISVGFDGLVDEQGNFVVTFTGQRLPFIDSAFLGYNYDFSEAIYTFDAKSRMIVNVTLKDLDLPDGYGSLMQRSSTELYFNIGDISYGNYDIPEIPQVICQNSVINDIISGDGTFEPSYDLLYEASDNAAASDISKIWRSAVSSGKNAFCTLEELSEKLSEKASEYDLEIVKKDYYINAEENTLFIRYLITQDDNEIGYIVMPLAVYGANIRNDNNILSFAEDELTVFEDGCIRVNHRNTSNITTEMNYCFYNDGRLRIDYKVTRESSYSRLSDIEELTLFTNGDYKKLQKFIEENPNSGFTWIDKYDVYENGRMNTYYIADDTGTSAGLSDDTISFVSLDHISEITCYDPYKKNARWTDF